MRNSRIFGLTLAILLAVGATLSAQDTELYQSRRARLLSELAGAAALLPGAVEAELESFRQTNNFYYLTGIEQPDLILVLSPAGRSSETLFLPERNLSQGSLSEAWTGEKLGPGEATQKATGITSAVQRSTFEQALAELAGKIDVLYFDFTPSPLDVPRSAAEVLLEKITSRYPHLAIKPLSRLIDPLRMVKDSVEIAILQKAVDITTESLKEAMQQLKVGLYEYEVEAQIEYGFHRRGSQQPGFPSIIGSGPNTVVLHYNSNRRKIEDGELVLMDVGAEFDYYTADVTRTVPANGQFTARQREIYNIVLAAQEAGIKAVRPGITLKEVHAAARKVIEDAGYAQYFIHYTSHFLGMDVHDVGSRADTLAPGMIITVEPGIYLPAEGIGVRIEDDVLVTPGGGRVMSIAAPRTPDEITSLMQKKER